MEMYIEVIIGNLCSVGAMISDSVSGTRKNKKGMLMAQSVSQLFYICSSLVLKGYSATVQNVVAIIRNLFAAYDKKNIFIEIILTALPVVLGIAFNNRGVIGLLPVFANLVYSVCIFKADQESIKLKYVFVLNVLMYSVFNFYILNFTGGIFNIIVATSTIVSLIKTNKKKATD